MTTDELQRLHAALLVKIPDLQMEMESNRVLLISTKFFLQIEDGIVSMSVLISPVIKFRYINMDDTIERALNRL
jgi:hypothetical protein